MKILSFGSLNLDLVYKVEHFVRPGETLAAQSMEHFCGGKGLNQSVAMAKAGAHVWHAGAVGESDGKVLLDMLESAGVDVSLIKKLDVPTGHAVIQVNEAGENCILLYGGANKKITPNQVDQVLTDFQAGDFIVLQNEINQLDYIIKRAQEKEMVVVINPSPMSQKLKETDLGKADWLILNEVEAAELCGDILPEEMYPEKLLSLYPHCRIVLTLGSHGCIYQDANTRKVKSAYLVKPVDTTGAGDTFTGFFVAAVAAGNTVEQALDEATRAAAIAVSRPGAAPAIPTRAEMMNWCPPMGKNLKI